MDSGPKTPPFIRTAAAVKGCAAFAHFRLAVSRALSRPQLKHNSPPPHPHQQHSEHKTDFPGKCRRKLTATAGSKAEVMPETVG